MNLIQIETLGQAIFLFIVVSAFITLAGTYLTVTADRLADQTGLGEAIIGSIFLGASTSLPGIVTSVVAAYDGHANLAFSNALGGIAVQTFFLCIADISYRKSNLEHASASMPNLMFGVVLILLLILPIIAFSSPEWSLWSIHPASIFLFVIYFIGVRMAREASLNPMWSPLITKETFPDRPEESRRQGRELIRIWSVFLGLVLAMAVAGYILEKSAVVISQKTFLDESVVGVFFTAIVTSIPELVVTLSAIRRGALTLAVAGITGGNCFDVLFLAFSDIAYRDGSLYHALGLHQIFLVGLTILLNTILVLGLLRREKHGLGNIGLESSSILILYVLGMFAYVAML